MKAIALGLLAATALTATAAQAQPARPGGTPYASPSSVISAEIAMSLAARDKGRVAALRDAAADGAVLFVPGRVPARDALKDRSAPEAAWKREPYEAWMSCDGSYAVTRGTWRRPTGAGQFVSLWQRQPKGGAYKWLLTLEGPPAAASTSASAMPDMIAGKVATCRGRPGGPSSALQGPGQAPLRGKQKPRLLQPTIDPANGQSDDGSLRWTATLDASGTGRVTAQVWNGTAFAEALSVAVGPQG